MATEKKTLVFNDRVSNSSMAKHVQGSVLCNQALKTNNG